MELNPETYLITGLNDLMTRVIDSSHPGIEIHLVGINKMLGNNV